MLGIDRDNDGLIVSHGPGGAYKATTCGLAVLVVIGVSLSIDSPLGVTWQPMAGIAAVVPLLLMLRLWTTTEYRFQRTAGLLVVRSGGPVRRLRSRELPLTSLKSVVDRRSRTARAIELVFDDRSSVVVAAARRARAATLDGVARAVSKFLQKPLELGSGAVLADRFEVERLIGSGGMGLVYRARDRTTGKRVAVKLASSDGDEPERNERFARERRLLSEFDHPRIARYVASGVTQDGREFLAMQWLDGEDLSSVLNEGRMSLADSLRVLVGVAEAVAVVHAQGVVHRDLKPGNLFLRGGSTADMVLIDFGVARSVETSTLLTSPAALIGTPFYMAPEQASSAGEISPAADIFSIGCIFYECLTGRRPFEGQQLLGVLARILYDQAAPVTALRPAVPEAWSTLITRMLDKRPALRPADGAALLAEIALLPPATEEADARASVSAQMSERDSGDQVLVCVVLATVPEGGQPGGVNPHQLDSIRSELLRFDCALERMADGSLLATVLPKPSATDQVRIAARCALQLREKLPDAKIALATGRAPLGRGGHVGHAVDRAAQLLAGAGASGIRLDEVSARLLDTRFVTAHDRGTLLLTGEQAELDQSRRLLGKPTPCVGRELELTQLEGVVSSAIDEQSAKAALLIAPPGYGKSRIRHELLRRLRDRYPRLLELAGYGDPLSAGSPYVLLADALRRRAGIRIGDDLTKARALVIDELCRNVAPEQRERVGEFLGELAGVPFPAERSPRIAAARGDHRVMSEQIALAFHDWLAAECGVSPVVLVLEDVQWGDALTVKVLDAALRDLSTGAVFVLVVGRPEVEETFPKLLAEHRAVTVNLRPLSSKASELLVRGVLGEGVGTEAVERIARLAAGNALFLEELIRAAAEGTAGDVPETVLAMLQARLSRMPPEARLLLRAASVLGETFWPGGVRSIFEAWGERRDPEPWLAELVESELLARQRTSRFPVEVEYTFRHALVCDAANGLLTAADGRDGHIAAGRWLEAMGENDGVVLARHAEEGGDMARASDCYARAAQQSVEGYDFEAALQRATKGIECGAQGQLLGVLQSVQSSAFYSKGQWRESAQAGLAALELLPRAASHWCSTVEMLMQVLPNVDDFQRYRELADEMQSIVPEQDARPAYLRAVCAELLGHSVAGAHARSRRCLAAIEKLADVETEADPVARGYARLFRAIYTTILGADGTTALCLVDGAIADLAESQVTYRLGLAHIVRSFCLLGLGRNEQSEAAARRGRAIAAQIHDDYHVALADWYLGLALSEREDAVSLDEAERCVRTMMDLNASPVFEGTSLNLSSRVAVAKRDWARAEDEGRRARTGLAALPPYALLASASLMQALTEQGRATEAAAVAREDLQVFERLEGPVFPEVTFLVTAAEALFAAADRSSAERALRLALRQVELRTASFADAASKQTYLDGRPENRRAVELAGRWLA